MGAAGFTLADLRPGVYDVEIVASSLTLLSARVEVRAGRDAIVEVTLPRSEVPNYRDVRARLAATPGVERVAWASNPLLFGGAARGVEIPGGSRSADAEAVRTSLVNTVDPDFFGTVGIALRRSGGHRERGLRRSVLAG